LPQDAASSKYLHIELVLPPAAGDPNLHQFKIVDARGQVVAEAYGFHTRRSIVVFEGDWSRLEGLYLAGAGHREPLIRTPQARQTTQPVAERMPPAKGDPPVVQARRPASPAVGPTSESSPPVTTTSPSSPTATAEEFDQEVLVTHRSQMNIHGLDFKSELQYRVLSALKIEKKDADGGLSVVQRVKQAEAVKADPLTQWVLRDLLGKLVGATFRFKVGPDGHVTAFEGATLRLHAAAGNNLLGGQGLQMVSIIDPDGWREIAELTFFQPQLPSEGKHTWERPFAHGWGPLGSWSGKVVYSQIEPRDGLLRFSYAFALTHRPPNPGGAALPFQIARADFQHEKAGGAIAFDASRGRVVEANEEFPVKGQLTIEFLGQEVPVGLEETQHFRVRVRERKPAVERPRED